VALSQEATTRGSAHRDHLEAGWSAPSSRFAYLGYGFGGDIVDFVALRTGFFQGGARRRRERSSDAVNRCLSVDEREVVGAAHGRLPHQEGCGYCTSDRAAAVTTALS
jgi:hypothetical protein